MPPSSTANSIRLGGCMLMGLALIIGVAAFLARCPWSACRYVGFNTYTITALEEYRRFLSNQAAFKTLHQVAGVKLECSALRDDVVWALQSGRLLLGLPTSAFVQDDKANPGLLGAWREDRVLHIVNNMLETRQDLEAWAANVREAVAVQRNGPLSFLPPLFGGLIIHIHTKQKPMVLFSDKPCSGIAIM